MPKESCNRQEGVPVQGSLFFCLLKEDFSLCVARVRHMYYTAQRLRVCLLCGIMIREKGGDIVMKLYLINSLKKDGFDTIITLLDYETQISRCLKSIRMSPDKTRKLLIDTILCSGMNEYRFIETTLNEDGTIDLNHYNYVNVNDGILKKANEILKYQPAFLKKSVLTESQIKKIAQFHPVLRAEGKTPPRNEI